MSQRPVTRDAILELLAHYPEGMTKGEIAVELGKHERAIESAIWHDRSKFGTANIRIKKYRPMRGKGGRASPVYVLGPGPDAERPDLSGIEHHRARNERYRKKNRALLNIRLRIRRGSTLAANPFAQLIQKGRA